MTRARLKPHHHLLRILLRSVLVGGGRLPYRMAQRLGQGLGPGLLALARRDRARGLAHLELAFPELDADARRQLLAATARHFGAMLGEVAWLWRARPTEVGRHVTFAGLEHLERARAAGGGAVLVTGHVGNWELLNAGLGHAGIPMTIAVRGADDPGLDAIATRLRARHGAEVVPRGREAGRRLGRALRANRVIGLLIDQDIRDIPGVFVPFFGRPAWTPSGAAALALRRRCPTVAAFIHRQPDGDHRVEVSPPLEMPDAGSMTQRVCALTATATAAIEAAIRAHPTQWVWMHRRWRTQPAEVTDGEA